MPTFIEKMRTTANNRELVEETFHRDYIERRKQIVEKMMISLTFMYYQQVKAAIEYASKHGRCYVHINFDKDKFKANFPNLSPKQVLKLWLQEMSNPNSKYLRSGSIFTNVNIKESFEGLKWDIWNNDKFTVVLCWDEKIFIDGFKWKDFWTGGRFSKVKYHDNNIQRTQKDRVNW